MSKPENEEFDAWIRLVVITIALGAFVVFGIILAT